MLAVFDSTCRCLLVNSYLAAVTRRANTDICTGATRLAPRLVAVSCCDQTQGRGNREMKWRPPWAPLAVCQYVRARYGAGGRSVSRGSADGICEQRSSNDMIRYDGSVMRSVEAQRPVTPESCTDTRGTRYGHSTARTPDSAPPTTAASPALPVRIK